MINVAAGIFIKNNYILIAQRSPDKNLGGYWEFPGGKQEKGESIFKCLEREIHEELKVYCEAEKILLESAYNYKNSSINLIAVKAKLLNENITLQVHSNCIWVPIDQLLNYQLAPADIPIAKYIIMNHTNL